MGRFERGSLLRLSCVGKSWVGGICLHVVVRVIIWLSVSSVLSISGGGLLSSFFGGLLLRCVCTIIEWMVFKFRLTLLSVRRASVSLFIV